VGRGRAEGETFDQDSNLGFGQGDGGFDVEPAVFGVRGGGVGVVVWVEARCRGVMRLESLCFWQSLVRCKVRLVMRWIWVVRLVKSWGAGKTRGMR
jgi:hypothetical protein